MEFNKDNFDHNEDLENEVVEIDDVLKMVFVGDSGVGKTNILHVFSHNQFNINSKSTIGVDFVMKTVRFRDLHLKLQIWDTAGQERYKSFTNAYYQDTKGILIVYDVTDKQTFNNVQNWLKNIQETMDKSKVSIVLIGNKIDLKEQRQVSTQQGKEFAELNQLMFMETSALDNQNDKIGEAFFRMIEDINSRSKLGPINQDNDNDRGEVLPMREVLQQEKSGCC